MRAKLRGPDRSGATILLALPAHLVQLLAEAADRNAEFSISAIARSSEARNAECSSPILSSVCFRRSLVRIIHLICRMTDYRLAVALRGFGEFRRSPNYALVGRANWSNRCLEDRNVPLWAVGRPTKRASQSSPGFLMTGIVGAAANDAGIARAVGRIGPQPGQDPAALRMASVSVNQTASSFFSRKRTRRKAAAPSGVPTTKG